MTSDCLKGKPPDAPAILAPSHPEKPTSTGEQKAGFVTKGILASLSASVLFSVTFFLSGFLENVSAEEIFSWRILCIFPVLTLILIRQPGGLAALPKVLPKRRLLQLPLILIATAMLGFQQWLFLWGPMTGQGLDVSLGYFLMPLVMVAAGSLIFREKLTGLRTFAVLSAAVGVTAELLRAGGFSWVALAVAFGYPLYFVIRRSINTTTPLWMWIEHTLLLLPAAVMLLMPANQYALSSPGALGVLVLLGSISAVAVILYLRASALLPFNLFGLLGYLEPLLLLLAALILGETLDPEEWATYLFIWVALLLLFVEGARTIRRKRQTRLMLRNIK